MNKKNLFLIFFTILFFTDAVFAEPASKEDIKLLIQHFDKRFEMIDKRFEAVDKRFESVDKRFDDMQRSIEQRFNMLMWFIGILTTLSTVSIAYIVKRQERHEEKFRSFQEEQITPKVFIQTIRLMNSEEKKELKQLLR